MEQLALNDFLQYRFLSQPKFSPDGKRAAFVVSCCNEEENCYESRLWLWDGASLRQLTDLGAEGRFFWEDATRLLFPAVRSKAEKKRAEAKDSFTSYYRLDVTGGEAMHAFTLPFSAGSWERLDDTHYAVVGSLDTAYPDYYKMTEEERKQVAKTYADNADYEVLDEIPFWINGGGFINKRRTALFFVNTETMEISRITEPLFDLGSLAVLEDTVYFTGVTYDTKVPMENDLYAWNWKTGEVRCLAKTMEVRVHRLTAVDSNIYVLGSKCARHGGNENAYVYILNPGSGELTLLRAEEQNMYGSVGSDCRYGGGSSMLARGKELFFIATREGDAQLQKLTAAGAAIPVLAETGSVDSFAISEHADYALLVGLFENRLQELYRCDLATGKLTRLSHFNDEALMGKYVAEHQPVCVRSCGLDIGGWVLLPKDFDPEKTYPAVLDIHGGPKTAYGAVFYHEMQVWANRGYFVFFCNPKGSDGRDNTFADIRGEYGQIDYQNLMDFTDAVLERYPQIDKKRVAVTGGSYGGFMTNWIIGHTDRFACAASQRSIANWLSFYGVSDIGYFFATDQCDGNPFDDAEKLWALSPLRYAKNVVTPTLFIHSDEDYRCPMAEGMQMFTALKDHGVPARLCYFKGENHELSRSGKPKHRLRRLEEITNWIEKYTK